MGRTVWLAAFLRPACASGIVGKRPGPGTERTVSEPGAVLELAGSGSTNYLATGHLWLGSGARGSKYSGCTDGYAI
ncbi:hypothetical protein D3C85_1460200 [compost metagenome]